MAPRQLHRLTFWIRYPGTNTDDDDLVRGFVSRILQLMHESCWGDDRGWCFELQDLVTDNHLPTSSQDDEDLLGFMYVRRSDPSRRDL